MGTHLGAVGFGRDTTVLSDQLHRLVGGAGLVGTADGDRLRVYRHDDPSGSSVTVTIEDSRVTCLTPGVAPGLVVSATSTALLDDDCPYERPLEVMAQLRDLEVPLAVTIDDLALSEAALVAGRDVELVVGALAERITIFADEAAYRASGTPMAVESLVPSGLFAPPGRTEEHRPSSRMLLSGVVTVSERREHSLFGHPFVVASVRSLGEDWQLAIDPADLGDDGTPPPPGSIVRGSFWISGHLAS